MYTCYHNFIVEYGAPQIGPGWGESSGVAPGGGGGEEEFSAVQSITRVPERGVVVHRVGEAPGNQENLYYNKQYRQYYLLSLLSL